MQPLSLPTVYAVSELSRLLRDVIESNFGTVWVEGEISNLARPASGHWYFTLKDGEAQLRAAMFKPANRLVKPVPNNGDQVRVRARLSVYPARGDLQLICEHMEPAGLGAKLAALEALKAQLQAEGLFDPALKRAIPVLPRRIGVITSATGAAVQDVMTTLARRFPLVPVILVPVLVQGEGLRRPLPRRCVMRVGAPGRMCCCWSVAAVPLKTCGPSTRPKWCERFAPAQCRSSPA